MQAAIGQLNDDLERGHGVRLSLRIGINTGEVIAGLLAGDVQGAYTVVGDTVNTAQRFESAAPLGGILVSEATWRLTRLVYQFEAPTEVTLRGKAEPQSAYRVLGRREHEIDAAHLVGRRLELVHRAHAGGGIGRGGCIPSWARRSASRACCAVSALVDDTVAQFASAARHSNGFAMPWSGGSSSRRAA